MHNETAQGRKLLRLRSALYLLGVVPLLASLHAHAGVCSSMSYTRISQIQGAGDRAPGTPVLTTGAPNEYGAELATCGVVTFAQNTQNGFFIQSEADAADADPATSEGVFVYLNPGTPPAGGWVYPSVGDVVRVFGTITEFSLNPSRLNTVTEMAVNATRRNHGISVIGRASVPAPVAIAPTASGGMNQLERFEGMRVTIPMSRVLEPTKNGAFFVTADLSAEDPKREAGLPKNSNFSASAAGSVFRFDTNPERLWIWPARRYLPAAMAASVVPWNVSKGQMLENITGVVHVDTYASDAPDYVVLVNDAIDSHNASDKVTPPHPARAPLSVPGQYHEHTIATFNVENLKYIPRQQSGEADATYLARAVPSVGPALSGESAANYYTRLTRDYDNKLIDLSRIIGSYLQTPDVVVLQEISRETRGDRTTAHELADAIHRAVPAVQYDVVIGEAGSSTVMYSDAVVVAMLLKRGVVTQYATAESLNLAPFGATDPDVHDRKPLIVHVELNSGDQKLSGNLPLTIVGVHARSNIGLDDPATPHTRDKRRDGAESIARWVFNQMQRNPAQQIVVAGDFNAPEMIDGYYDVINAMSLCLWDSGRQITPYSDAMVSALSGAPSTNCSLRDAVAGYVNYWGMTNPAPEYDTGYIGADYMIGLGKQYSYIFSGSKQLIDHILVSTALQVCNSMSSTVVHVNSHYPKGVPMFVGAMPPIPNRVSDHDPALLYIRQSQSSCDYQNTPPEFWR